MDALAQRVKGWDWLGIFVVAVFVAMLGVVVWGAVEWITEPEPTISRPSIVNIDHPSGGIVCVYTDEAIDCMATWWVIPTWIPFEEAKALYNIRGATNGQ